jgi:antirestriction protein ArdC
MWVVGGESADKYAREELIAEIGAAILCNACGIIPRIENAAAYCQSWLKEVLNMKETALMSAFTQAWKATEYIQGRTAADTETTDNEETQAA